MGNAYGKFVRLREALRDGLRLIYWGVELMVAHLDCWDFVIKYSFELLGDVPEAIFSRFEPGEVVIPIAVEVICHSILHHFV